MMQTLSLRPLNDRVVIKRIDQQPSKTIALTDSPKGLKGIVVAVGPGKWMPGEWWYFESRRKWEWIPGYREDHPLKPGMKVLFNSKWNDFSSQDFYHVLPVGVAEDLHLVQVGDVYCILGDDVKEAVSLERQAADVVPKIEDIVTKYA
jgi:hypothetical protein